MAEFSDRRNKSPVEGEISLDRLSSEVLATIMTKLDVPSICATSITCKSFLVCAQEIFKFLPNFHLLEIAAPIDRLRKLLLPNASLRSLKLDCRRLNDSSVDHVLQPGLLELSLRNCFKFSGKLLSEVGGRCKDLRCLYVSSMADNRGHLHDVHDLEELLRGCTQLEELVLMFDLSIFRRPDFARAWTLASPKLNHLQIGYITQLMVIELLTPTLPPPPPHQSPNHIPPPVFPNIHKLCLSVDYISNTMVTIISHTLIHLTHLDLRDQPMIEPAPAFDLTDEGLQLINQHGRLKHLSLIRSQEFSQTFFRRVTDQGILFMADRCKEMEAICLGGFCQVTDTGFKTLLHSCTDLHKFKVFNGTRMTDLVFLDMYATSLALTLASLRCCNLLTDSAVLQLVLNTDLIILDFRDSRNIGDKALQSVSKLPKLKTLLLDGTDVTDLGLSYLKKGSLAKLSIRGCKRLTCKCISSLFSGGANRELRELDLSNLRDLTNAGVLFLVKNRIPLVDLRMRQCPLIGDTSVMALASMTMADGDRWHGSSLRSLDVYNCGGISKLSFQWLKKPYFPGLRWLGVGGSINHELVESLAVNRPLLHLMSRGEELGSDKWDNLDDIYMHDYEEVDELEQWISQEEDGNDDDDDDTDDDDDVEAENAE